MWSTVTITLGCQLMVSCCRWRIRPGGDCCLRQPGCGTSELCVCGIFAFCHPAGVLVVIRRHWQGARHRPDAGYHQAGRLAHGLQLTPTLNPLSLSCSTLSLNLSSTLSTSLSSTSPDSLSSSPPARPARVPRVLLSQPEADRLPSPLHRLVRIRIHHAQHHGCVPVQPVRLDPAVGARRVVPCSVLCSPRSRYLGGPGLVQDGD